jgi:NADH-quinone oxidoreductase subunit C
MSENDAQKPPEAESIPASGDDAEAKAEAEAKKRAAVEAKARAAAEAKAKKEAEEAAKPIWERDPAPPTSRDASEDEFVLALSGAHDAAVEGATQRGDELTLDVARDRIAEVCATVKKEHGYHLLVDICGVDYPDREDARFEVVYHVYSIEKNHRLRLKVRVAEDVEVPTVTTVWRGADWCEREAYDMYGIRFSGHPDMTRILLWEGFNGYPLRKDFPIEGIDTGAAIYPEYYEEEAGPVTGIGTGWKPPQPPEPEPEPEPVAPGDDASNVAAEPAS